MNKKELEHNMKEEWHKFMAELLLHSVKYKVSAEDTNDLYLIVHRTVDNICKYGKELEI